MRNYDKIKETRQIWRLINQAKSNIGSMTGQEFYDLYRPLLETKQAKNIKLLLLKGYPDWSLENHPEWVIEFGKIPKPYKERII